MNNQVEKTSETFGEAALDILRIETALSRYPIHRLANKGTVTIDIRKKDPKGTTSLLWDVDFSNRHGQPGPLAYKLDTLVINRRIDEAGRPVPKVLRLGSLHEIARELDLERNTSAVRKALLQNVGAIINAKITYKAVDKTERSLEGAFSRYSVVFTGEQLPDGRKADCVYLVLNDLYAEVINAATRRPQDYDYLKSLPPGPQRFYEIVSYEILPAIKYNQRAKLPYSEFCMYSTMTRYFEFDQVKKQMYKIHQPHIKARYITKVEYEATVDDEGRPDWNMFYIPGETAKRQQLVFDFTIPNVRKERVKVTPPAAPAAPAVTVTKKPKSESTPYPQLPLVSGVPDASTEAKALVRKFYRLRYGKEQEPTEKETAEAKSCLSEGELWAEHLIEFAAKKGKEKDSFPNDFGGVKKLSAQARDSFEAKEKKRSEAQVKKARQSHQEAHTGAYHAFLGELLGGRLETSLPEAYASFKAHEDKIYHFHQVRADKSAASAKVIENYYSEEERIKRLYRFIEENPQSGLPNFWQWDEKMNPTPLRGGS